MTYDEIVKALNCCGNQMHSCSDRQCKAKTMGNAVELIVCQKAEIERLKKDNEYILMQHAFQRRPSGDCWNDVIEKAKTEAIEEFARRFEDELCDKVFEEDESSMSVNQIIALVDNLEKVMTNKLEENNNER